MYNATGGAFGGKSLYHNENGVETGNLGLALTVADAALSAPGGLNNTIAILAGVSKFLGDHATGVNSNGIILQTATLATSEDGKMYAGVNDNLLSWSLLGDITRSIVSAGNGTDDVAGVSFHASFDDEIIGVGITVSAFFITRGVNSGFYATGTVSGLIGDENGVAASAFTGRYLEDGDPDPNTLLGSTFHMSAESSQGGYYWSSFNGLPYIDDTWRGIGRSTGPMAGAAAGFGNTFKLYGF